MPTITLTATATRHLRHVVYMGGWVTAGYFDNMTDNVAARDELLAAGLIEPRQEGRHHLYGITGAGRDQLAELEA